MLAPLVRLARTEARRVWGARWLVAGTSLALGLVGVGAVLHIPSTYDAWGQIYVNPQTPLAATTEGVALSGANYGSPYVVQKTLLNDSSLETVVKRMNPSTTWANPAALEVAVARLRAKIHFAPDPGEGFVEMHVTDTDPIRARNIAQQLVDHFISGNVARTRTDLGRAHVFLEQQIADYEAMVEDSQGKIAAFRREHPGATAILSPPAGALQTAAPATGATASPFTEALAEERSSAARSGALDARILELENRLASLRSTYTDQYPDVVATQRQLALAVAERRATPTPRSVGSKRLGMVGRGSAALRLTPIDPSVAATWSDLQKTDELLRANHQQLLAKRSALQMSQAVYGADHGKYQITRRPTVPIVPSGPNRLLYLGAVVVLALGGGLGVGYLRVSSRDIFVSPQELERALQLPVIGTISNEPAWRKRRKRQERPDVRRDAAAKPTARFGVSPSRVPTS